MSNERTFTFKESVALLQINPKSFLGWLKKAGIDPDAQVDTFDPRKKFLTQSQLERLAEEHGRVLPPFDEEMEQPNEGRTVLALAEQVRALQQQQREHLDYLDRRLAEILALVQQIASGQQQLLSEPMRTQAGPSQSRFAGAHASVREPHAPGGDGHSNGTTEGRQKELEPAPPRRASPASDKAKATTRRVTSTKTSTKKKRAGKGKKLPSGLIVLRDFASLHQIAMERASATAKTGKITIVRGKWLVHSRWATEALDATGQQQFYEVFHDRRGFVACDQCPHREHA